MTAAQIVALLVAFVGSGTIAGVINGVLSHRKGVRDSDLAEEQSAIDGFQKLNGELREDLNRLREDRDRDAARTTELVSRVARIEQQLDEERTLRSRLISYVRSLLAWIDEHLPDEPPPPPPPDLAEHIPTHRKDPS